MQHILHSTALTALAWAVSSCSPALAQQAPPPPAVGQRALDEAALMRRIEEYAGTEKGQARAAQDRQARAAVQQFVGALLAKDVPGMLAASDLPWADHAELLRDEGALRRYLAKLWVPRAFAQGPERITLLDSLEALEQALGRRAPAAARKTWANLLGVGSRVAVVQRGPMVLGVAARRTKAGYKVCGVLFDYFPKPDDPLLRAITRGLLNRP